jgi:hypothetical protein
LSELTSAAPRYVCSECGRLGPIASFNDECKPGWTHGRLIRITTEVDSPVVAALEQAVETLDIATEVIAESRLPKRAVLSDKLLTATRELREKVAAAIEGGDDDATS